MDLFEFQGKALLRRFGVPIPDGKVASSPAQAGRIAEALGGRVVVKAQVQVGGRGKAGGIKLATGGDEAREVAGQILSMTIKGHRVRRVLVERAGDIKAEFYGSFMLDRAEKAYLGMMSARGGVDIEEVAATNPEAIAKVLISPLTGLQPFHLRRLVFGSKIPAEARKGATALLERLFECFVSSDASLVEVNPMVLTADGAVIALDAKVSIDESGLYRQPHLAPLAAGMPASRQEKAAKEHGLNYVQLDGVVGIIGNGAGLTMSTLDLIAEAGGTPANFLDIGGGANAEAMAAAIGIILSNRKVRSLLVNIFGGITRCDLVAAGILEALKRLGDVKVPIVVRLDGTNAEQGRAMLADAANIVSSPTMLEAARMAVAAAKRGSR